MAKAFVDTTVLTNILLKSSDVSGKDAKALVARYRESELPVYAIKEFKSGPLRNFAWMHNKLAGTKSFFQAIAALQKMSLTPRRYTTATALEALREATRKLMKPQTAADLAAQYGDSGSLDLFLCDQFQNALKASIYRAWNRRRQITTAVVGPLNCYQEAPPVEERGQIELNPVKCHPSSECCLADQLRRMISDINKLRDTLGEQPTKRENEKRAQALRSIARTPKRKFTEEMCRNLGDAYFVLFAPEGATILTTNSKDIGPLASVLNKSTEVP